MFDVFDRIRGILMNIFCPENKERLQRNSLQVHVYVYTGMFAVTRDSVRHGMRICEIVPGTPGTCYL